MSKRLIVKPVHRQSVQGRHKHSYFFHDKETGDMVEGNIMHKNKALTTSGLSCTERICFKIEGGRVQAGMSEMVPNAWYIGDVKTKKEKDLKINQLRSQYGLSEEWSEHLPKLLEQEDISKQRELEIKAGVDPDTYTETVPTLTGKHWKEDNDTELMKFAYRFYDDANILRDDSVRGRLAMQLVKVRDDVFAKNRDEANPAQHHFYIAEEMEYDKISKRTNDLVNEAVAKLWMMENKYPMESDLAEWPLYQIASLLLYNNKPVIKDRVAPIQVSTKLNDYIKSKNFGGAKSVKQFLKAVELFDNNKELFHIKYVVQQGFNKQTFSINNGAIFWHSQKNKKEWYRFTTREALESFLYDEYKKHNPKEPLIENAYHTLMEELKLRAAVV